MNVRGSLFVCFRFWIALLSGNARRSLSSGRTVLLYATSKLELVAARNVMVVS
jgi:hypothetical protein